MFKIDPRTLLFLFLVSTQHSALGTRSARAEPFNLEPPPIGDRSAGMGATGTASSSDASALFYNPAGIGLLPGSAWRGLLSGYAELGSAEQKESFLDQDVEVATLDGMLGFAGLARAFPWGGVGLAFLSPERRTEEALKKFGPLETTLSGEVFRFPKGSLFVDARTTTMEAGPALAVRIPGVEAAAGVELLYSVRRSQIARAYSLTTESGDFLALQTSFQQLSQAVRIGYGFRWNPASWASAGAAFSHSIPVEDDVSVSKLLANIDQDEIRRTLTQLLAGEISQEEAVQRVFTEGFVTTHGEFKRPSTLRAGVGVSLPRAVSVALDGVYYFPTEQKLKELPAPFDRAWQEGVFNLHVGAEKDLPGRFQLRAGFYTDRSTHPSLSGLSRLEIEETGFDRRTPRDADLFHLTTGLAFGDSPASVSMSVNYGWGEGKIVDVLGNVRRETRQDLILGLGASVEF